jgi:hypothetical protein
LPPDPFNAQNGSSPPDFYKLAVTSLSIQADWGRIGLLMAAHPDSEQPIHLLWTGGWDSTFQLLRLLLTDRRPVIPFYLIDPERPSTGKELQTMKRIKERLFKDYPHTRELLHPSRYFAAADVAPDAEIAAAFEAAREKNPLGIQYDWLARFCRQNDILDMQLCVHRDDHARITFRPARSQAGPADALSRWFSFPVLELSKLDMARISTRQGWDPIMQQTWFCHTPKRGNVPCGKCSPCRYVIKEGMGWRIPEHVRRPAPAWKRRLRPLNSFVKKILPQD